jgi:hypothetical protein
LEELAAGALLTLELDVDVVDDDFPLAAPDDLRALARESVR